MSEPKNKSDLKDYQFYCNHDRSHPVTFGQVKANHRTSRGYSLLAAYQAVQRVEMPAGTDVAAVCVWQLRYCVIAGNFLLVFDDNNDNNSLAMFLYLPEASVKACSPGEVLACGRKDVVIIAPAVGLVRSLASTTDRDDTLVASVTVHFETDPQQWNTTVCRLSAKKSLTARLEFSTPLNVNQKVHLNIVDQKGQSGNGVGAAAAHSPSAEKALRLGNFGASHFPAEMLQFMVSHGVTAEDLDPDMEIGILESCMRIVKEREEPSVSLEALMHSAKSVVLEDFLCKEDPKQMYDIQVKIDAGMQGEVFKAVRKSDNMPVAIKRVVIKNERKELPPLSNEVAFLHAARHKNVVGLYTAHRIDRNLYLAMEMMDGGKLTDLLESDVHFSEKEVATIMREVLQGLAYLHRQGCVHRDIKSDNILSNKKGELKIGDFGFAASAVSGKRKTVVGTPYWMAPEVARGEPYGFPADVWSMGIFLIELCDGLPPWMGVPPLKALVKIATLPPPEIKANRRRVSKLCHDFAKLMLQKAPGKRLTCEELLQHPFVSGTNTFPDTSFLSKYLAEKDAK